MNDDSLERESVIRRADELAATLAHAFRARSEELYLIGGSVRDRLLGLRPPDLDLATSALPDLTAEILGEISSSPPFRIGEKFGTIAVHIDGLPVEITTYRTGEQYSTGSRKPTVRFGATLLQDLERRDFTVNAMACDPVTNALIDPLGGVVDLKARSIRAVGKPEERFGEDPLRLLRAVRFATTLDFEIEPRTWLAVQRCNQQLDQISRERVRDEIGKVITSTHAERGMGLLRDSGLLVHAVPALIELTTMPDHGPRHSLSLWDHVMRVLVGVPNRLSLRWAALLHDIAKPRTRTHDASGRPRFFHHDEVGAAMARETLTDLRYSRHVVEDVALLVETHMQLHAYSRDWSDGALRRLLFRLGSSLPDALALARADAAGHMTTGDPDNSRKFDVLEDRIARLGDASTENFQSPLNGGDLMERYGRPPGAWIGRIKDALEHEVIEGRLAPNDRTRSWQIADEIARETDI